MYVRTLALLLTLLITAVFAAGAAGHPLEPYDVDDDEWLNQFDNCPANYNPKQQDLDKDAEDDVKYETQYVDDPQGNHLGGKYYGWTEHETVPVTEEYPPTKRPFMEGGDACDEDDDGDLFPDKTIAGYPKKKDNCSKVANPDQKDADADGLGDACDTIDDRGGATTTTTGGGPDRKRPKLTIGLSRRLRLAAFAATVPVPVRCSEACKITLALTLGKRVLGRGSAKIDGPGLTFVFLKAKLPKARGTLRPVLKVKATDGAKNRASASVRLTVRR